jgi:phage shock protein B
VDGAGRQAAKERTIVTIAVEGALILVVAGVAAILVALAVKLFKGAGDRGDDARIMQEVYEGLSRLEQRIEALETILLDRRRKGGRDE